MNSIFYRVNKNGQYKNYMNGSYTEMKKASAELIERATSKGFKMVKRSFGCCGVILTFSDGKTKVEIVYIKSEKELEWLKHFDKVA